MGTDGATGRKDAGTQISRLQPQFSEAVESVRNTFRLQVVTEDQGNMFEVSKINRTLC